MGFYDKQIRYLDLWEYGEKVGNAGFAKIEVREEECRIWISVKGLYPTDVVVGQLYLLVDEEEILADQFLFHQGMGTYAAKWSTQDLAQMGITYPMWSGLRIKISEQRKVEKCWKNCQQAVDVDMEETLQAGSEENRKNKEEIIVEEAEKGQLRMNKWDRLGQYYKKKKPFGDEREYLCISPEDLIVLPEKYEYLYKNSFLLHGYYAYGHILLGAEIVDTQAVYKLCIPGMGHDKERVVAGMFGFGNFIPAMKVLEDHSLADARGIEMQQFGYYQMTVEL